jgi:hypothetical protein
MIFYSNHQDPPVGYIRLTHDTIKTICNLAIKNINETQKKNQEKYVEEVRQEMNHPWWTFGYGLTKKFTTEDAINKIEADKKSGSISLALNHLYKYPDATGDKTKTNARELLKAIEDTNQELTVNIEKWNNIKRWSET